MKTFRQSRLSKPISCYLAFLLILQVVFTPYSYGLTSGPSQPEFNSFTPIATSDMVDLSSGDFGYNLPIMDVGGYPINLSYQSGVTMDQESSWVGLGWNLNVGQISRQVRGLPDDFKGDELGYENHIKKNVTVGTNISLSPALLGNDAPFTVGLGVQWNNYEGISFKPSAGVSFDLAGMAEVGVDLSASVSEGASARPSLSFSKRKGDVKRTLGLSAGLSSRKGLENLSMSVSATKLARNKSAYKAGRDRAGKVGEHKVDGGSLGGSFSFNTTNNYTPSKRIGHLNKNFSFDAALGGEIFGLEGQVRITGFGSTQKIADSYLNYKEPGYGYDYTHHKSGNRGVLDFNRENERMVNKHTTVLPTTVYTYDLYSIQGQGVSGMFRPFKSQVNYLYNDPVSDLSQSASAGVEVGLGNLIHGGLNFTSSPTISQTGKWSSNNLSRSVFEESNKDNNSLLYRPTTFKLLGEINVDQDQAYLTKLNGFSPERLAISGSKFSRKLSPVYQVKTSTGSGYSYSDVGVSSKIKRTKRRQTNQTIQKILASEADEKFVFKNTFAKAHHTAGIQVFELGGTRYIYGKSVYNTKKIEASFDVGDKPVNTVTQTVTYNGDLYGNHNSISDQYVNRVKTPAYAHSYLITSVLSSDYEDLDDNGPSDSDLGSYTLFEYTEPSDSDYISGFKWRTPFKENTALFNQGLKTSNKDQKGNYIYGEKEVVYLKRIETKTHVAFFDLEDREDCFEVIGEHGGKGTRSLKKLVSIRLYSKAELSKDAEGKVIDPGILGAVSPIKMAHFTYVSPEDSLCQGIPSAISSSYGKLTLDKVFFTHRSSGMGRFTPYKFHYTENKTYGIKSQDIWGNYKENTSPILNTTEFPFVNQSKAEADLFTRSWTLNKVDLPSGGSLSIDTESDDYQYVQNRKAMRMFKVIGAGNWSNPTALEQTNDKLFDYSDNHSKYLYVKVDDLTLTSEEFINNYLSGSDLSKPIYFKFLVNMTLSSKDYVSGYFKIDQSLKDNIHVSNGVAVIPLEFLKKDGGVGASQQVNPIAKAGWGFGRTYLNRAVYSLGGSEANDDFESAINDLVGSIAMVAEIFTGPNGYLENKGCARVFDTKRSWIRLQEPDGIKYGGGLRVKSVRLSDNWGSMIGFSPTDPVYNKVYGQSYDYMLPDGTSSGVATFEPNESAENPFVEPFYANTGDYADRIAFPKELNYVEKPFGKAFFPSAKVTYSTVTVKNLDHPDVVTSHKSGKVVTEFYTSKDFPTRVEFTDLNLINDQNKYSVLKLFNLLVKNHLTGSQGFSVITNDMDGKKRSNKVYAEGQEDPISSIHYHYNTNTGSPTGKLSSQVPTINSKGVINRNHRIGLDIDVVNDFNQSYSRTEVMGYSGNLAAFLMALFPITVPLVLPKRSVHETKLNTAVTTKVVHQTGILVRTEARDIGAKITTSNLAWDAQNGQVLLTEVNNEYGDRYYNFNYPAYWYYHQMGPISQTIDLKGVLTPSGVDLFELDGATASIDTYLAIGDQLALSTGDKAWVYGYESGKVKLIDYSGNLLTSAVGPLDFKLIRSAYANKQHQSMASVTLMSNPLLKPDTSERTILDNSAFEYNDVSTTLNKVINASAIEYSDHWLSQCENGLPNEEGLIGGFADQNVNPFLYNIKGQWRAVKSYAYLTGRNNFVTNNTRKSGYFDQFKPFYRLNADGNWSIASTDWTFANQVTKYSPYGPELESKDALNRHSSAQYGYNYTLPMAVTQNSSYEQMGYDGFEDYPPTATGLKPHFGFSTSLNSEVNLNAEESHTGHYSLAVSAGAQAVFERPIGDCKDQNDHGNTGVDNVNDHPVKPIDNGSVKPVEEKPIKPVKPIKPIDNGSVKPVEEKPIKPVKPIKPIDNGSVKPVEEKPIKPVKPIKRPIKTQLTKPVSRQVPNQLHSTKNTGSVKTIKFNQKN